MVDCICIDAKNKPVIIPDELWVKEKENYQITHIYRMVNQKGIQGCDIKGKDISAYIPYNCFRLDRFAFTEENITKLIEMMKECTDLNDADITELLEQLELETIEEEGHYVEEY